MHVDGSCHCGSIEYSAEIDPARVVICHCTDCQSLSGSAFRVVAFTLEDRFTVKRGTPKTYVKIAASGRPRVQGFCGHCGSALYATSSGDGPKVYGLRVGTIQQRDTLKPSRQLWCRSAQTWLGEITGLPGVDGQT
jgi:hypothetical protein